MNLSRIVRLPSSAVAALLFLTLLQPAIAQKPAATQRQPLWKIEGKRATVYLLGSLHCLKEENYPLAEPLESAFNRSKVVVFETDLEEIEKPEMQMKILSQSTLPPGEKLKDQLSPKAYERLVAQLKETGLPVEAVQSLKPGILALTIAVMEMQKLGLDPKLGVDHHFHQKAKKAGKEIMGLEAASFQADMITGFSKEEGEALLNSTLKDMHLLKDILGKLIESWKTGDMKMVASLLNQSMEEHPVLIQRMLVDRNKNWVPKIEALIRGDKDAIVIVGTGHLAGQQSVIELLEKNGAKVVQQ